MNKKEYVSISDRKIMAEIFTNILTIRYPGLSYEKALKFIGYWGYELRKEGGKLKYERIKKTQQC